MPCYDVIVNFKYLEIDIALEYVMLHSRAIIV